MSQTKPIEFLPAFYRCLLVAGAIFLPVSFLGGWRGVASFATGFGMMALLFFTWDVSTLLVLNPERPSKALGIMFISLRYVLIGLFFYAMMRLFVPDWAWFLAGTMLLFPSLLVAALTTRSRDGRPDLK